MCALAAREIRSASSDDGLNQRSERVVNAFPAGAADGCCESCSTDDEFWPRSWISATVSRARSAEIDEDERRSGLSTRPPEYADALIDPVVKDVRLDESNEHRVRQPLGRCLTEMDSRVKRRR